MKCERCGNNVPDFAWSDGDHLILLQGPMTVSMSAPDIDNNVRMIAEIKVKREFCSKMFLPKPDRIFDWTTETELEEAVGQAVGAASACWDNLSGAGVFESTRAKQIVDELVEYIKSKEPIY